MKKKNAFTFVELIVVIIIIVILTGISYLSFKNYPKKVRDGVRITNLEGIQKSLGNYETINGYYPEPDGGIMNSSGWIEGYFGTGVKEEVGNIDLFLDPKTNQPYTYIVSSGGLNYKLETDLELTGEYTIGDTKIKTDKSIFNINSGHLE